MQSQTESKLKQLLSSQEEPEVGITEFISKGNPIAAVTKFMLTDFIVNEISEDGNVIHVKEKPNPSINPVKKVAEDKISYQMTQSLNKEIIEIFGKQAGQAIQSLYSKLESGQKITQWQHTIENMQVMNKQERSKIHAFVRQKLTNIESNTLDGNKMKLKLNKRMRKINPAARNKYIHFILFKSNIDTMGAIFRLSKLTGINQKLFSSAGLKDKRGVTTQLISVFNTQLSSLQKFYQAANKNREIWIEGFKQHMDNDIGVGNLFGNQFGLILRLINPNDAELIADRVKSLRQNGLINYFGMQRFGSCGTKTHMIGLRILKRQWKQVIEELLLEETRDQVVNKIKHDCYNNEQYAKAERSLPNKYKIEKNLFKGLKKHGKNYQNVFESLPRSMRTLYLHSLQSYLWNRIVSRRIIEHGLKVRKGDIVGRKMGGFELAKAQVEEKIQQRQNGEQGEKQEKQEEDDEQIIAQQIEEEQKYETQLIESEEHIENYQITDVLFPLYGPSINLPKGSLAYEYLQDELKKLDLTEQHFVGKSKKFCFKGMYRKMIIKPQNVEYCIISHQNVKDELQTPFYLTGDKMTIAPGTRKAVQLIIQLPKSSYATMALREVLHIPSSFETQMILNKLYETQGPTSNHQQI